MPIFINMPYKMIGPNIKRILDLNIGIEVYANNNVLDELDMNSVKEVSRMLQDKGIVCTAHAPFMDLSPGGFDKMIKAISKDKIKKAVEMAHLLHAKSIVCHPGYDKWRFDSNEQLWLESSIETWTEVISEAKDDLVVMLENIFEETPSTLIALFDYFKGKNLYFCFDSGHFNLFSTVALEAWLVPLRGRIREMHLHDNHGKSDEHLPVGRGTFPFRELKAFLRQTNGEITYTTEVHGESHAADSIKNIRESCHNMAQRSDKGGGTYIPKAGVEHAPVAETFDLSSGIVEMMRLNKERAWALSRDEITAIREYFLRQRVIEGRRKVGLTESPTDVEMEALARAWSEHCKHKIFSAEISYEEDGNVRIIDGLFKTYILGSTEQIRRQKGRKDFCLSVFTNNGGMIRFNRKYNLAYKVETHDTPSALDSCGGSLNGIAGVSRDPFGTGKGAKPLFNTDVFCFAPPDYKGQVPPILIHPKRAIERVREGVEQGWNKSGMPTVNSSLVFDQGYLGKPLVYCGTCGIMPRTIKGEPTRIKKAVKGDAIITVGCGIGNEGVHGAPFSSEEISEVPPSSAVRIGGPITRKRMTDFLLIARDLGLYNAITDNGAGGLSSSIGEIAEDTNGCVVHLEKAPLKCPALSPREILLSEAREQMTVAVSPEKVDAFMELSEKMDVESTVLGEFIDTGEFHIVYEGKTVAYIDMDFLHGGLPKMKLPARWERRIYDEEPLEEPKDYNNALLTLLRQWNVCSKEYVARRYDHEAQGGGVVKQLSGKVHDGPSDAGVVRPDPDRLEGIVVSHGICPKYSKFDTYHMVACATDEAIRNNIATGGSLSRMALLDNFCWSDPVQSERNPEGPYRLAQLVRANRALHDYTTLFGTPCISAIDSIKNDYMFNDIEISIPQTVLVSAISVIHDIRKVITMDFKTAGDHIVVVGKTYSEMGGSEYFSFRNRHGNIEPRVRGETAKRIFRSMEKAIQAGIIRSCHDVSDGGIGCALAESAFAGGLGADIDLSEVPAVGIFRDDFLLFSESASRFIVTVSEKNREKFKAIFRSIPFGIAGKVRVDGKFLIKGLKGNAIIDTDIDLLKHAWQAPFKEHFNA